ncbi:sulfate transporter [Aureococcus anophagefferens]|uniref:Sulfate transporter n=1 Tax=Aureococcus anophagefferens TaxID=44056 RepID=A0ABR1FL75_AURAN
MDTSSTTSAIATAGEDEDPWTILTSFSLRKYIVSSVEFYMNDKEAFKNELLSGVTVAVMQVPESVAFSFVAGVPRSWACARRRPSRKGCAARVGAAGRGRRYSTFFLGLITALIGGKPGMISGAAGAMAVVIKDLMTLCGVFQLAKLVKLISKPCMIGFMNGLGIVIFMARASARQRASTPRARARAPTRARRFGAFKTCPYAKESTSPRHPDYYSDCKENERRWMELDETKTWLTLLLVGFTMMIMLAWPRVIPARCAPPSWHVPQVPADGEWGVVFQYAISLTFVGLIESVMTLQAVDEITEDLPSVFRSNQECVAQGVANLVSGLFGAMGGDAMIGQSTINVSVNGARGRLSGAAAGVLMLVFVVFLSPVISVIPIGTLTGVLFMVVLSTFCFDTFRLLPRIPRADAFVIVETTAIGVVVGSVTLATFDAWNPAWNRGASFAVAKTDKKTDGDEVTYSPLAPLFFGTVKDFSKAFAPGSDPKSCVVDLERSAIADYSALVALADVAHRYALVDKRVKIKNASEADAKLARASGPAVAAVADAIDTGEAVGDPDAAPLVVDGAGDVEAGVELRAD